VEKDQSTAEDLFTGAWLTLVDDVQPRLLRRRMVHEHTRYDQKIWRRAC
jgi:hypothetical protein